LAKTSAAAFFGTLILLAFSKIASLKTGFSSVLSEIKPV